MDDFILKLMVVVAFCQCTEMGSHMIFFYQYFIVDGTRLHLWGGGRKGRLEILSLCRHKSVSSSGCGIGYEKIGERDQNFENGGYNSILKFYSQRMLV